METFRHPRTMRNSRKRRFSREHRQKLSEARKGQKPALGMQHSASTRKRLSEATKGSENPMWGRKHTSKARERMRAAWHARRIRKRATEKSAPSPD